MALVIDVNQSKSFHTTTNNLVTDSFTTHSADQFILVLFVVPNFINTITDSAGLTYTELTTDANQAPDIPYAYYAFAKNPVVNNQITINSTTSNLQGIVTVLSFVGTNVSTPNGSTSWDFWVTGDNAASLPQITATTNTDGTWVFGAFGTGADAPVTAISGCTIIWQDDEQVTNHNCTTVMANTPTSLGGTNVTLGFTSSDAWNGLLVGVTCGSSRLATGGVG